MSVKSVPKKGYKMVPWLFGKEIEIPEEWEFDKIENFCDKITSGGTPNRSNSEYYQGQIPWIKSGELNNDFISNSEEKITEAGLSNSSAKLFPKNTVLIAMYGATIGKTAITEIESTTNQAICAILPNSKFDSFYLQQLLISMKNILISFGMGAGQPNINQEIIKTFHIIFPPLPEQQKIASILSNVDNLIQNTDKLIEKTTRLKKGLMQELLVKGIGHTKFKKVKWLFGKEIAIPEEWASSDLENSLNLLKDGTHNPPPRTITGIPLLSSEDIHNGIIDFEKDTSFISKEDYSEMQRKYEITINDILLTVVGTLGRASLVRNNKKFAVQRSVAILRTNKKIDSEYLYNFIQSNYFQIQMDMRKNATAQSGVYLGQLAKIKIIYPDNITEQKKIASILSNTDEKIQSYQRYKEKLQRLKKSLMQKLLTGEVRVAV